MTDPKLCPRIGPESGVPCYLPDTREAHRAGHEGRDATGRGAWHADWFDHMRWARAEARQKVTTRH